MLLAVLYVAAFAVSASEAQLVPGIFGPATGVCGPITVPYGGSGSGSQLQTFVAPSPGQPTAYTTCNPSINDTYVYTLGPSGLPSYSLTPALRVVGTDISPALGYFDTPKLDLTKVTPLAGAPTPIPAGTYDVGLRYNSTASSEKCLNGSHTSSSVFIIQAPTTTSLTGPATTASGSSTFTLTVNVTYSTAAVQLPFSNPAAIASGSVQITTSGSSPQSLNGSAIVSANGTGFVTYRMTPAQPLAVGSYSVVATYTPTANFVYGSTSSPYVFTVTPAVTTPPPTSTAAPTTSAPPTTTAKATTTAAPKTTTSAPKTTTAAPKTTSAAPKSTTAAPKPTTRAPPTTTPKPTTTKPPPTTRSPIHK